MKPNNTKKSIFIYNYIFSPITVIIMFWVLFFDGDSFSLQKIIDHKSDPKLYFAIALAIAFLLFLRHGMKFPKNDNK